MMQRIIDINKDSRGRPALTLLRMMTAFILAAAAVMTFTACGETPEERAQYINVLNMGEYIDTDLLDVFEEETGYEVNYNTIGTSEELYAKLRSGGVNYDVVVPSDYMVSRMIEEGMCQKIDWDNVPNAEYVDEDFLDPSYDPTGEYSVPYQYGTIGIVYNKDMVDPEDIGSWDLLWNEKYAGNILMFDSSRDSMDIALKLLGKSSNTENEDDLYAAADLLKEQKPLVQAYIQEQIFDKMEGGEAAASPVYTGDYYLMLDELGDDPDVDLGYYMPKEGSNLFVDAMVIPSCAGNKEGAEAFINFLCDPEVMAQNTEWIYYATAETAARELLPDYMRDNDDLYPRGTAMDQFEICRNLPKNIRTLCDALWVQVLSS